MPIPPDSQLGPYTIRRLLGAGGMGEVYHAYDPRLDRDVAIKLIRDEAGPGSRPDSRFDRLLSEATLASALNHPNIVTIYETGVAAEGRYLAMELVRGETLRTLAPRVSIDRAVEIARQVAEALAVAHRAQIVHRDIKPENVMVRSDGYVKVLDFGLARVQPGATADGTTRAGTGAGVVTGTIGYMSPEQARGAGASPASDIFSLGVMVYELTTGRHPFAAASVLGTLHALLDETPEPPCVANPDVPRAVEQLIIEMLHKDPRLRPGAEEVLYRLSMVREGSVAVALSSVAVRRASRAASGHVVGRELELDGLLSDLDRAARGRGGVVVIAAEAGMGKTTIVEAFLRHLEEREDGVRVGRGRCSERLAGSEAYLPVIEALDSLRHDEQHGSLTRLIRTLAPTWYAQIAAGSEREAAGRRVDADASQDRFKREILSLLEEVSRAQPLVLCLDDIHWADPSTTELIAYLAHRLADLRILLVLTCRPSELAQSRHPFAGLTLDLIAHGLCREVTPGLLDERAVERYIALQFPEHTFPAAFTAMIHRRTGGHPLFMADLLRDLRRRGIIEATGGRWALVEDLSGIARGLPESVRSLVQRKVDALEDEDRRLLTAASVQGLDFDSAILCAALRLDAEDTERRLERLEREHALVRFVQESEYPDRTLTLRYRFAHHIYQHAFDTALRVTRRAALSGAIGDALLTRLGANAPAAANDLARLFEAARDTARACEYYARAAENALHLYAHDEAVRLSTRGLALLAAEPDGPGRASLELPLQMALGLAMKTGRGYAVPEVGAAYARARELSRQVQDPRRVVPVLVGLAAHHVVSGEIETSRDVALEMLALFERLGDPNLEMLGQWSLGAALFHLGELEVAHAHLARAIELYDPAFHAARVWETGVEPGVFAQGEMSRTLTLRGYPDQGLACARDAVERARALDHPQPRAFALLFEIFAHLARREPRDVLRTFAELETLCQAHGIAQELQWAAPLRGRALVELGDVDRGVRDLADGLEAHTITRSALLRPYYFVLYAGALLRARRFDDAQRALDDARRIADATRQFAYDAEHDRIQGELFVAAERLDDAEASFRRAIAVATEQGARWFLLRASRACAHLLIRLDRTDEADAVLRPVFDSMTEGFDTPDYRFAEALLRTLCATQSPKPKPCMRRAPPGRG
ncbi:MAG TPA: protein kinase [Vicinamibacterales bacterium]|nr:protein kinase [Vicinamibacterales bacterium]